MAAKISIIIPIYNVEQYLNKCIESVVNQSYRNLEIILVDDGSPDGCPSICDEWAKKDNRIKVIHKENGGLSDARNYGIEASTGDYLMFLDSDDYIDKNMCYNLLTLIDEYNCDFAMSNLTRFNEGENPSLDDEKQYKTRCYDYDTMIDMVLHSDKVLPYLVISCAKLYKRNLFKNIRYPLGRLHEDEYVIHNIICESKNGFAYHDKPMYFYLQRATSMMGKRGEKNIVDALDAYKLRYDHFNLKIKDKKDEIVNLSLELLRLLYLSNLWCNNKLKKSILSEFKKIYKTTHKHVLKDFIFRHFRWLYVLKIKIQIFIGNKK